MISSFLGMKSESSKPSVPPQMMPQMMNQQQQMVPNQFVNNHHQLVDQFGRPIQKSSSSSSSRQPIQHHHQQQRQQQVWPDQRNMSLPYPQQQQKVSSHQRPSSHQHRHSMGKINDSLLCFSSDLIKKIGFQDTTQGGNRI